jgi:hypothetical protein
MATTLADFRSSDTCSRGLHPRRDSRESPHSGAPVAWESRPGEGARCRAMSRSLQRYLQPGPSGLQGKRANLVDWSTGTWHGSELPRRTADRLRRRVESHSEPIARPVAAVKRDSPRRDSRDRISIRQDNGAYASGPSIQPLYREKDWFRPRRRASRLLRILDRRPIAPTSRISLGTNCTPGCCREEGPIGRRSRMRSKRERQSNFNQTR